jgi:serine/threonine-protein kinase
VTVEQDIERRAKERVGTTLRGKYRLERLLGIGGMGAVFAAVHTNNRNRVAIKMLHTELSINAEIKGRFLREGYIANTVEHPGVVRVLDDDTSEDGAVFLVLELMEGESLASMHSRLGKLEAAELTRFAIDLLHILDAAHEKGIVHRDIKPDNVFVTHQQVVKILDFGIARLKESTGGTPTRSGQSVGTPAFMAPEQALGHLQKIGPHTDVWSVGATMFTLLTGRFAHDAESLSELLVRSATQPVVPIGQVNASIPAELATIIDKALAFEIAHRWKNAREMQSALADILPELRARAASMTDEEGDEDIEHAPTEPPPSKEMDTNTGPSGNVSAPTPVVAFTESIPSSVPPPSSRVRPFVAGSAIVAASAVAMLALMSRTHPEEAPHALATNTSRPLPSRTSVLPAPTQTTVVPEPTSASSASTAAVHRNAPAVVATSAPAPSVTAAPKSSTTRPVAHAHPIVANVPAATTPAALPPSSRPPVTTTPTVDPLERQ